jgi:hypothetical protein
MDGVSPEVQAGGKARRKGISERSKNGAISIGSLKNEIRPAAVHDFLHFPVGEIA